jgi:hypothetical protein
MTRNCHCGGRLQRTDVVLDITASLKYGRSMFRDTDSEKANWKCDKCGATRTQRKRQAKAKVSQ